jgi:hypothetical protein
VKNDKCHNCSRTDPSNTNWVMSIAHQVVPPAIAEFVRQRLTQYNAGELRRNRWLRWFIWTGNQCPEEEVQVKQFSNCDIPSRSYAGACVGLWLVSKTKTLLYTVENDPIEKEWADNGLVRVERFLEFTFAITSEGDKCVIEEVDFDGRVRRAAYELPNGTNSSKVGAMLGSELRERIHRKSQSQSSQRQF